MLASDWPQSSDLPLIDQALAGATRWSVQVSDFRGINPESEQTFGGPLDLQGSVCSYLHFHNSSSEDQAVIK